MHCDARKVKVATVLSLVAIILIYQLTRKNIDITLCIDYGEEKFKLIAFCAKYTVLSVKKQYCKIIYVKLFQLIYITNILFMRARFFLCYMFVET